MATVELIDEYGNPRVIDESEMGAALDAGWREPTPEELQAKAEAEQYGTLGESLKGVGERALSGATVGLSDVALSEAFGDEYRAAREARGRQLGAIGTGAEIAGAVAPALLTFGESAPLSAAGIARGVSAPARAVMAAGRVGEGLAGAAVRGAGITGRGIIGRGVLSGAELAAGGAIEGGLYGAGQALSEAALAPGGNYDELASKMIAGGLTGAEFGAIGGGLLGFTGGALTRSIEKGANRLVGKGGLKRMLEQEADNATIRALGAVTPSEASAKGEAGLSRMAREVRDATLEDGTRVFAPGASKEEIYDRVVKGRKETGVKLGELRREVNDAIETTGGRYRPELRGFFDDVDAMVAEARMGPRALASRAESAAEQVAPLRQLWESGGATLEAVTAYRRKLDEVIRPPTKKAGIRVAPENMAQLERVRAGLEARIEAATDRAVKRLLPDRAGEYAALKSRYGALSDAAQLGKREAGREIARNRFSPFETGSALAGALGTLATGNPAAIIGGGALAGARYLWRSRGESALAVIADRVARSDAKISAAVAKLFRVGADARRGATGALAANEVEEKGRVARVLKQRKEGAQAQAAAYRKRLEKISRYTPEADPDMATLTSAAPQAAIAAASRQARARDYLLRTAPSDLLDPNPARTGPNRVLLEQWARRLEMVDDPAGTVSKHLANGTLTREHVETLRLVDPPLYAAVVDKIQDRLVNSKTQPPYQQRVRLGLLFGIVTDKSMRPEQIAATQSWYQERRAAQQATQQGPAGAGPATTDMASGFQSESQRIESGQAPA